MAPKSGSGPSEDAMLSPAPAPPSIEAFLNDLHTFQPLVQRRDEVEQGRLNPAHIEFRAPAKGRSNALAARYAQIAVADHQLPSQKFEALHVTFSPKYQAMLCVPKAVYDSTVLDLYQVTWSKDGKNFHVNMAFALEPLGWASPAGMVRRAPVYLYRNVNGFGTVLYIDLKASKLRPAKKKSENKGSQSSPGKWV